MFGTNFENLSEFLSKQSVKDSLASKVQGIFLWYFSGIPTDISLEDLEAFRNG